MQFLRMKQASLIRERKMEDGWKKKKGWDRSKQTWNQENGVILNAKRSTWTRFKNQATERKSWKMFWTILTPKYIWTIFGFVYDGAGLNRDSSLEDQIMSKVKYYQNPLRKELPFKAEQNKVWIINNFCKLKFVRNKAKIKENSLKARF